MRYIYQCPECGMQYEIEHSIAECDTIKIQCENHFMCLDSPCYRVIQPVLHVGEKVKQKTKNVKAIREHSQQLALDKKRGLR